MNFMKSNITIKKPKLKNNQEADYTNVILERMEDSIKLVLEGQVGLQRQFDVAREDDKSFRDEMYFFRDEMCSFRDEMYSFRKEVGTRFDKVEANQTITLEYLSRTDERIENIEKELKEIKAEIKILAQEKKVSREEINFLLSRVEKLESILIKKKILIKV